MEATNGSATFQNDGVSTEEMFFTYSEEEKQQNEINRENAERLFRPKFIPFYPEVVERYGLTNSEAIIYGFIDFYTSNGSGRFYFTNEQLANIVFCGVDTVSKGISKLQKCGLIEVSRKMRAGGGQIRYVKILSSNLGKSSSSNLGKSLVATNENHGTNNNKIKENKIKKNIYHSTKKKEGVGKYPRQWLRSEEAPIELHKELGSVFLSKEVVEKEVEKMNDWLDSTGRRYKNYMAFGRNWLRRWKDDNQVKNQREYSRGIEKDWEAVKKAEARDREESIRSTAELLARYD